MVMIHACINKTRSSKGLDEGISYDDEDGGRLHMDVDSLSPQSTHMFLYFNG